MTITVPDAIKELLRIVALLRNTHSASNKAFTLDGRLLGDIGEVLVAQHYDLTLFEDVRRHHDATAGDGRLVQIKATMQHQLTVPARHVPDYYIGIKIHSDGSFDEIFNGPGAVALKAVSNRRLVVGSSLHSTSLKSLRELNAEVADSQRIPRRAVALDSLAAFNATALE
jgi:hypothetical protein